MIQIPKKNLIFDEIPKSVGNLVRSNLIVYHSRGFYLNNQSFKLILVDRNYMRKE